MELFILCEREPVCVNLNFGVNDLKRTVEKKDGCKKTTLSRERFQPQGQQLLLLCSKKSKYFALSRKNEWTFLSM